MQLAHALFLVAITSCPASATAAGSNDPEASTLVPAASQAFEIGLAGGYTQPFGELPADVRHYGLIGPGAAVALDIGYRVNPYWSVSSSWQAHESLGDPTVGATLGVLGLTTAVQCTHRFLPFADTSPFLSFGAGYRVLWLLPDAQVVAFHGIEVAKMQAGFDLMRPNENASFGALIGFDLSVLMFNDVGGTTRPLDDPRPVSFIFAALAASFDIGGQRVGPR